MSISFSLTLADYRCQIQEPISEGNRTLARMVFTAIHRGQFFGFQPTGKPISCVGAAVFTHSGSWSIAE